MCIMPVGEGAIRVRTGRSDIELEGAGDGGATAGAPLSMRLPGRPSLGQARAWLVEQVWAQADRWTLWTPVAFGLGCGLYFALGREPQAWVAWALLPIVAGLLAATRWSPWRSTTLALVMSACALGGFAVAKLRTESVKAPVAQAGARPQVVDAWVVDIAAPGRGRPASAAGADAGRRLAPPKPRRSGCG